MIVHIDTLRSLVDRPNESNSIFVKLNEKNPAAALEIRKQLMEKTEEVFKVDTEENTEDKTVKVDTEEDDSIVLDTSTGKGLGNMEIPEHMRAPAFEDGKKVRIFMNEQYGFPHGIQITAGIANHKPQLVGKPSDVERHTIDEDDIVIEIGGEILWRASEDGFPDTQKGPEWVTEILNKVVGTESDEDDEVHEPENQEVIN